MNIGPIILFEAAVAILILSLAFIGVIFHLTHSLKKITGTGLFGSNAKKEAVKIIDDAKSEASDIINKSTLSANIAADNFNQEIAKLSATQLKEFEKATSDFTKIYSQVLADLKTKNIEVFQNISKDIETNTTAEINSFKETVEKLTINSQKEVKKKIDADYAQLQKELENYKKEKLAQIDDKIYELLEKVSKMTLGKAVSLSEHENLIIKALEKAKKEGAFAK